MAQRQLRITAGPDVGRICRLPVEGGVVLGSSHRHAQIHLNDLNVARVHCQIDVKGAHAVVTALDERHETYVNGARVQEQLMRDGDYLTLGQTDLRLEPLAADDEEPEVCEVIEDERLEVSEAAPDDEELYVTEAAPDDGDVPEAATVEPEVPETRIRRLAGTKFGHYAVDALVAEGPVGCVYRAHNVAGGGPVALKILHPQFPANIQDIDRFVQSVKGVMPLRHEHLIGVVGAGRSETYAWLALEYVSGKSLHQLLTMPGTAGMLNWRHVLRVAVHLARALEYAHANGALHRHLTPRDVLVRDSDKVIKLNDLVLVQAIAGSALHKKILHDQPPASWCYLAPEQTKSIGAGGIYADLYGMGAVLFTALTGKPPCLGANLLETIGKIRQANPARPKECQFSIPDAMEAIVLRLLAKQSEARAKSAEAVRAEFEELAAAEGVAV